MLRAQFSFFPTDFFLVKVFPNSPGKDLQKSKIRDETVRCIKRQTMLSAQHKKKKCCNDGKIIKIKNSTVQLHCLNMTNLVMFCSMSLPVCLWFAESAETPYEKPAKPQICHSNKDYYLNNKVYKILPIVKILKIIACKQY